MINDTHEELEYLRRSFKTLQEENLRLRELLADNGISSNARQMPSGNFYDCPTIKKIVVESNPVPIDVVAQDALKHLVQEINDPNGPLAEWVRKGGNP